MTQSVGIIGHGLTGITAAIMLARAGYQVDLIGPKPEIFRRAATCPPTAGRPSNAGTLRGGEEKSGQAGEHPHHRDG